MDIALAYGAKGSRFDIYSDAKAIRLLNWVTLS